MTTVLTLTTLRLGVREELPVVDYSTALDIFLIVSFCFVLAALVEYIIIHYSNLQRVRVGEMKMRWQLGRSQRHLAASSSAYPS